MNKGPVQRTGMEAKRIARTRSIGRGAELARLEGFMLDDLPRALALVGEPGIGKTTLWEDGLVLARTQGVRVLSARASGADTRLSFAALVDLLDGVETDELVGLPPPQLRALEVALLRAEPEDAPPGPHAIALGFLNAVRALAAREPLLIAIDDVQWLDPPSAEALDFAVRRLERERVGVLLARRPGSEMAFERALGQRLRRLGVGSLSLGAMRRILSEQLGLSLTRQLLRRVHETTLGNPLFALEIGHTLLEHGPPALGEEIPVPDNVEGLLGTRVERLPGPVRRLLLLVALSADLRTSQAAAITEPEALEAALEAGVVLVDGDRLRASHPLLAAAARSRSPAEARRELHLELAHAIRDSELRALHLALATERPDPELATAVAAAAETAFARGAPQDAASLAEHALRLTPADAAQRGSRLLALAELLNVVGETRRATELVTGALESLSAGSERGRAYWILVSGAVTSNDEITRYLELALAESGTDLELRAASLAELTSNVAVVRVERLPEAEGWAREALSASRLAGPDLRRLALYALGWARALRGRAIDDIVERFLALSEAAYYIVGSPERVQGQRLVWRGELTAARTLFARLLALADERGEPVSYFLQRLHACELELRAGEWGAASRLLEEWGESDDRELLIWPMYERCRALLAAGRGDPDEAEGWATTAIARAASTGVRWDELEALRARGIAALLARDPARALESLLPVWEHTQREGVGDPGAFPVAPELVEALAELGEQDAALETAAHLRELAEQQEHPWGLASARRSAALARLASSWDEGAAAELGAAAAAYAELGLRFDRARTLLGLGRAQRRHRKWGAARATLEQAAAAFVEMGSLGWADTASSELARVGARRPPSEGQLTPAERRVAELASEGLSNKEIARELVVSVKTVEAHLSHAYAKLGVRSRAQLARRLAPSG